MTINYSVENHFLFVLNRKIDFFIHFIFRISVFSKHHVYSSNKYVKRKSRTRHLIKNFRQTYRSLCLTVTFVFRLFIFIDKITRELFIFIEKIIQIIRVIYGWIQMIRAVLSTLHLLTSRFMLLISHFHRIFHLLSILFEPLANRTLEKSVRSFSNFLFYYYSSHGGCYTLQARTRHIVDSVRARWKRKRNSIDDNDIYYDAFTEEYEWI